MTNTLRQKNQRARAREISAFSDLIQGKMCAEMNVINVHGVILQWLRKAAKIVFEIITWSSGAKNQQGIKTLKNTLKTEAEISFTFASRFAGLIK